MLIQVADYKFYEYELDFLKKEIAAIGGSIKGKLERNSIVDIGDVKISEAIKLTYIQKVIDGENLYISEQDVREKINGRVISRVQSKRYGPHGLHEYKGRFNPQTPRSLLNQYFYQRKNCLILDPFAGSGTTLVEARGLAIPSVGIELNPLACLIANAKKYYEEIETIPDNKSSKDIQEMSSDDSERNVYLRKWFPGSQYNDLSKIIRSANSLPNKEKAIFLVILSNLLRDHSLQEPKDLRIRKRKSVPINMDLMKNFTESLTKNIHRHQDWISMVGLNKTYLKIINGDSTLMSNLLNRKISGTVSSPPYASALPYIDTYRLSMVALGLVNPRDIVKAEKMLIGARDINSKDVKSFNSKLIDLPTSIAKLIKNIYQGISSDSNAGFRKRAVPYSLANYCHLMQKVLREIFLVEEDNAVNCWILGPNRVKIHEGWFLINTPEIVGELAEKVGFKNIEIITMQAYARYNIHSKNSINKESLLLFKR